MEGSVKGSVTGGGGGCVRDPWIPPAEGGGGTQDV